jgi:hypothetical protein
VIEPLVAIGWQILHRHVGRVEQQRFLALQPPKSSLQPDRLVATRDVRLQDNLIRSLLLPCQHLLLLRLYLQLQSILID